MRVRKTPTEAAGRLQTEAAEVSMGTCQTLDSKAPTSTHAVMDLLSVACSSLSVSSGLGRMLPQADLNFRLPCSTLWLLRSLGQCLLQPLVANNVSSEAFSAA